MKIKMARALSFLPNTRIIVSMIIMTGYVYPQPFCLGMQSVSGRPIPPDPRESPTTHPGPQGQDSLTVSDHISGSNVTIPPVVNTTMQPQSDFVNLSLLSSYKDEDRIICPTTANSLSSAIMHFLCETNGQLGSMHYELNNKKLHPFFNSDSVGTCIREEVKITGVDFHIIMTVTNNEPKRVSMFMFHQSSNFSTAAGESLVIKCATNPPGSDITNYSDSKIRFKFSGMPGEPINQQLTLNNETQCHNISLWPPKPNHSVSEIDYFKVELKNSNNFTIVPTTQWDSNLTLCSYEQHTHYNIIAVDKCGRHSDSVQVELEWDMDQDSSTNTDCAPSLSKPSPSPEDAYCIHTYIAYICLAVIIVIAFIVGLAIGECGRYCYKKGYCCCKQADKSCQ